MTTSYGQLIHEHGAIEIASDALLGAIARDAGSDALVRQLGGLAVAVEDHIRSENDIVSGLDQRHVTGPWILAWKDGLAHFERLCADWQAFIAGWSETAIERDRDGFEADAQRILGRLKERMRLETDALYATALQTGAITLR